MTSKVKVLVVDDEALIRRSLAELLPREGYDVVEAENGPGPIPPKTPGVTP